MKELHFLCCDQEDAIIGKSPTIGPRTDCVARNVLFFTLLIDETFDIEEDIWWAIYFDVSVDSTCFDQICKQAGRLISLSENISDWHDSKYGKILTFVDEKSLLNVRTIWQYYHSLSNLSLQERTEFSSKFMKDFGNIFEDTFHEKSILRGLRAFGPIVIEEMDVIQKLLVSFWSTGIVGKTGSKPPTGYLVNPLFVYSTVGHDQCAIDSETDPILAFHCTSTLTDIRSDATEYCGLYSDSLTDKQKVSRVVKSVKIQFKSWCSTFRAVISSISTKITICNYTGDALQLCYALQHYSSFPPTDMHEHSTAPWNPGITFDNAFKPEQYRLFDVIDATRLMDSTPLPIVLISTIPLLQSSADATIFTSRLQHRKANFDPYSAMESQLFCDPIVFCSLFGVAPAEYVTGVYHGAHLEKFSGGESLWRFSWKRVAFALEPGCIQELVWDADSLTLILHEIYVSVSAAENPKYVAESLRKGEQPQKRTGFTRRSFINFLRYLTLHIKTEWPAVLSKLCELATTPSLINLPAIIHHLDFNFHLFRNNLYRSPSLKSIGQSVLSRIPESWRLILGNAPLSDTMSFIFRIPRTKLSPFVKYVNDFKSRRHEVALQINLHYGGLINMFSSFEMTFGKVMNAENVKDREIQVDNKGWNGNGDLFVFIDLPVAELFQVPATTISLNVDVNAAIAETAAHCLGQFGPQMLVFEAEISNQLYFWPVVNTKPQSQFQSNDIATDMTCRSKDGRLFANPKIFRTPEGSLRILFRVDLQNQKDKKELELGAPVDVRPISFCITELNCGSWKEHLVSPFSIQESSMKIRIARKSGWIELGGNLKLQGHEPYLNFHTLRRNGKSVSWSVPRLNIDILPTLNLSPSNNLLWIRGNLKSMFSAHEEGLWMTNSKADPMVEFKGSMFTLISAAAGWTDNDACIRTKPSRVILIADGDISRTSIILFITGIKLNEASDSIIIDAHILLLSDEVIKKLSPELDKVGAGAPAVISGMEEYRFWKCYLRTIIEQNRSWSHSEKCDEITRSYIRPQEDGMCRCGEGQVSADFRAIKQWEKFIPHVIRCPLIPIFPTPYSEAILSNESVRRCPGSRFATSEGSGRAACLMCHKTDVVRLKKCSRCEVAQYCSKECQRDDWKRHKKECGKSSR